MKKVEYYTKNKKVYHYEPTEQERKEIEARKLKTLYALRKQAQEERAQHILDHSKGYCPHCYMLRPLTGICPNCD